MRRPKVIVVGAGVAGLYCVQLLIAKGCAVEVWEAEDRPGGRVQTDTVDGFQLDRGFQVLQTDYPEAKRSLSYDALQLSPFEPGSLIQTERGQVKMVDPWRKPTAAFATMFNHVGSLGDRLRLARMRAACFCEGFGLGDQDCSTDEWLSQRMGFSGDFVSRFLRPWISGMFFDESLETSARFFQFIFRTSASGDVSLPSRGIGAISEQLANRLPDGTIRYQTPVQSIEGNHLVSTTGYEASADAIVLAVDSIQRQRLLPSPSVQVNTVGTACFYFAASSPPPVGRFLVLNGELESATGSSLGPISNLCVPSNVSSSYAPEGQSLICVSVRPSLVRGIQPQHQSQWIAETESAIREQASRWFGKSSESWRFLHAYVIPHAVPRLLPGRWNPEQRKSEPSVAEKQVHDSSAPDSRIVCCGDYMETPSLQGALVSGRRASEQLLPWIK